MLIEVRYSVFRFVTGRHTVVILDLNGARNAAGLIAPEKANNINGIPTNQQSYPHT